MMKSLFDKTKHDDCDSCGKPFGFIRVPFVKATRWLCPDCAEKEYETIKH